MCQLLRHCVANREVAQAKVGSILNELVINDVLLTISYRILGSGVEIAELVGISYDYEFSVLDLGEVIHIVDE